jgi:hypothetical protein
MAVNTTVMTTLAKDEEKLKGDENYELLQPSVITQEIANEVTSNLKGLLVQWNCLEKAKEVNRFFGHKFSVFVGSMMVVNKKGDGSYGYYFRPPFEFHAWCTDGSNIYDFGLAGVITSGLRVKDHLGYILQDMKPVVLAGTAPKWIIYRPVHLL